MSVLPWLVHLIWQHKKQGLDVQGPGQGVTPNTFRLFFASWNDGSISSALRKSAMACSLSPFFSWALPRLRPEVFQFSFIVGARKNEPIPSVSIVRMTSSSAAWSVGNDSSQTVEASS